MMDSPHIAVSWMITLSEPIAGLNELNPVAKRISGVEAPHMRQCIIGRKRHPRARQLLPASVEIIHEQRRVRLPRRCEAGLDAQMNDRTRPLKPAPAAIS